MAAIDFADGPVVAGCKVVLPVAWLAWSRYRVVVALRDRTAPSVFAGPRWAQQII